jgi:hypothetical protein
MGYFKKNTLNMMLMARELKSKIKVSKDGIDCEMSSLQWTVYQKFFESRKEEGNYFDTVGLQVCNLVCGDNLDHTKR